MPGILRIVQAAFTSSFVVLPTPSLIRPFVCLKPNIRSLQSRFTTSTTTIIMSTQQQQPQNVDDDVFDRIQAIIGTDAGGRGMKSLIVEGDLKRAAEVLGTLGTSMVDKKDRQRPPYHVVVISGFPCCVDQDPPTETDGPPGTLAIARAAAAMYHKVTVATDVCNEAVFRAGLDQLAMPRDDDADVGCGSIDLQSFPADTAMTTEDHERLEQLRNDCDLLVACERAGPGQDGHCYTMRGINMNAKHLIAPLHLLASQRSPDDKTPPFVAIGDGGNELGMGKVIDNIINNPKINDGRLIGCVVPADHLIAASVSNWGGYALAAAAAVVHAQTLSGQKDKTSENNGAADDGDDIIKKWVDRCLPTEEQEIALLNRCVAAGCRDGVSGKMEATVDGMPLETSLQCLRDIRLATLRNFK